MAKENHRERFKANAELDIQGPEKDIAYETKDSTPYIACCLCQQRFIFAWSYAKIERLHVPVLAKELQGSM